jgi:Alpha/beta hydrolase of unknown function (DUF900)
MSTDGFIANISCRLGCDGVTVANSVWYQTGSLEGVPEFVMLVHGYNDDRTYADCAYANFLSQCSAVSGGLFRIPVAKLQWPGDETNAVAGTVEYPRALEHAIQSSAILAVFLEALARNAQGGALTIHWVAHSMGNRLVLETIQMLRAKGVAIRFSSFALMAAAVRVGAVDVGGPLRTAAQTSTSLSVLYSTHDEVLEWAFPVGQTAARDGFFPEAIGRHGYPENLGGITQGFNWFGHSDYWFSPYSAAFVLANMGAGVDRMIVPSCTPSVDPAAADITPVNTTPERSTPSWVPVGTPPRFANPC